MPRFKREADDAPRGGKNEPMTTRSTLVPVLLALSVAGCEIKEDMPGLDGEPEEPALPEPDPGCARAPSVAALEPTRGRPGALKPGSFAIERCSGVLAFAWAERVEGTNDEIFFALFGPDGAARTPAVRISNGAGASDTPRVLWAGDRFVVLWQDARHDAAPATCGLLCRVELYHAAIALDGALIAGERRVTNKPRDARHVRGAADPTSGAVALAWSDGRDGTGASIHMAMVDRAGRVLYEIRASDEGPSERAVSPWLIWHGREWILVYSVEGAGGARVHARSVSPRGDLGEARRITDGMRPALVDRGADGYTLLSQGGISNPYLDFMAPDWSVALTVPAPDVTSFDGSWAIAYDGRTHWVMASQQSRPLEAIAYDQRGVAYARKTLGMGVEARDVEMELVGDRIVAEWFGGPPGAVPGHRIVVVASK